MRSIVRAFFSAGFTAVCLWAGSITLCVAQPPNQRPPYLVSVQHMTTEQGLPNRSVTCFGQDSQGFVWVGTPVGAYRFDGKTFTTPSFPAALKKVYHSGICGFGTDRAGNFWLQGNRVGNHRPLYVLKRGQSQPQLAQTVFKQAAWLRQDPIVECDLSTTKAFRYVRTAAGAIGYQTRQCELRLIYRHSDLAVDRATQPRLLETKRHTVLVLLEPRIASTPRTLLELDSTGRTLNQYPLLSQYTLLPIREDDDGTIYFHHLFDGVGVMSNAVPNPHMALYTLHPGKGLSPVLLGLPPDVLRRYTD